MAYEHTNRSLDQLQDIITEFKSRIRSWNETLPIAGRELLDSGNNKAMEALIADDKLSVFAMTATVDSVRAKL
jgi:hypothetical protein